MSHHINFDLNKHNGKTLSPKNDKKEVKSAKKKETKKLEIDNKQMEWRLNQLKLAMEKEKEERGKKAFIWQSGKDGALESHARNVLGRTVKSKSAPSNDLKKARVTVLSDEPLNLPKRKSHSKELIEKLKRPIPPKKPAASEPTVEVNKECWVSVGFDRYSDDVMELQSDQNGNLPLTALQGLNPSAIGLYYMRYGRKRLLLAIDDKVIQPKTGWGNDVYYPYVANVSVQKAPAVQVSPDSSRSQKNFVNIVNDFEKKFHPTQSQLSFMNGEIQEKNFDSEQGNLLDGSFDEEANALAFKEAVLDWRNGSSNSPTKSNVKKSKSVSGVTMADHDVQSEPLKSVEVKFSETSTLSYMEKILLQKHRRTAVPPMPDSAFLMKNASSTEESILTTEELDEKKRCRDLFVSKASKNSDAPTTNITFCTITEVDDDEDLNLESNDMPSNTYCYVEEASDGEDVSNTSFRPAKNASDKYIIEEYVPSEPQRKVISHQNSPHNDKMDRISDTNSSHPSDSNHKFIKTRDHVHNDSASKKMNAVQQISKVPFNPDAFYQTSLDEYYMNMEQERLKLYSNLNLDAGKLMMCKLSNSQWLVSQNFAGENNVDGLIKNEVEQNEDAEREHEDYEALEKLEWELASQTGNITSDGRISRLIDEWSADDNELGIVNDPGFGSGLSTPDPEPVTLVGTSLTWQDDGNMVEEFQRMEHMMLDDQLSYRESIESDSR